MSLFENEGKETPSIVEELVGEGKKFKTIDDLANGKLEADNYIEELKAKLAEAENAASKENHSKELLEQLRAREASPPSGEGNEGKEEHPEGEPTPGKDVNIKELVENVLTEREQTTKTQSNVKEVEEGLRSLYGDKAKEMLASKAKELGVGVDFLSGVASNSPSAFFKLIGETSPARNNNYVPSGVRTDEMVTSNNNSRNWNFYKEMRKKDPARYRLASTQRQIIEDRTKQGASFYN